MNDPGHAYYGVGQFRGGTALNQLHLPEPLQYSEDIDLMRTAHGPVGPTLDRMRETLSWLGDANLEQSPIAPRLIYRTAPEHGGPALRAHDRNQYPLS